jgi:glycosyltransferase involved in cell wall biosynthesis
MKSKVSLILLTSNEIDGCKKIVPMIPKRGIDEFICVDLNSTDGTVEYLKNMGYKVYAQKVKGRGIAFRIGMEKAKGDVLVYFSPDGNENPKDIPKLIQKINYGYDMAIASRFHPDSISEDATLVRKFGNLMFTGLINLLWGTNVTDAVNGFRAIRKEVMKDLKTRAKYFEIEIEMTIKCSKKRYKITEIPTVEARRIAGKGKLKTFRDGWLYTKFIFEELVGNKN